MRKIKLFLLAGVLSITFAACTSSAQDKNTNEESATAANEQGSAPQGGMRGGFDVEDEDAPSEEADLMGTIANVAEDGTITVNSMTIPEGDMPAPDESQQPPADRSGEERPDMPSPEDGESFNPDDAGERTMPQGEETEVSLTDQTVIKQIASNDDEQGNSTIEAADIEQNATVRIWLDENGDAEYVQVMSGMSGIPGGSRDSETQPSESESI